MCKEVGHTNERLARSYRVVLSPALSPEEIKRTAAAASGITMDVHGLELRARNLYSGVCMHRRKACPHCMLILTSSCSIIIACHGGTFFNMWVEWRGELHVLYCSAHFGIESGIAYCEAARNLLHAVALNAAPEGVNADIHK